MNGERRIPLSLAQTVGDDVSQMHIGGQLLVWTGLGRVVMMPDGAGQILGKTPLHQHSSANFGVIHAQDRLFGFQEGMARRPGFLEH